MTKLVEISNRTTHKVERTLAQDNASVAVPVNSDIKIVADPKSVTSMLREGDDLIIRFADGSTLRLDNYFACSPDQFGQISIDDPATGADWLVNLDNATCFPAGDATSAEVAYDLSPLAAAAAPAAAASGGLSTAALIGLGVAGAGIAVAAAAGGAAAVAAVAETAAALPLRTPPRPRSRSCPLRQTMSAPFKTP